MTISSGSNTTTTTTADTPAWYDELAQNFGTQIGSGIDSAAGLADNWYSGPLVAGLTPEQQTAMTRANTAGGFWSPYYNTGWSTMQGAVPYYDRANTAAGSITSGLASGQNALTGARTSANQMTSGMDEMYGAFGGASGDLSRMLGGLSAGQNATNQALSLYGTLGSGLPSAQQTLGGVGGDINMMTSGLGMGQNLFNAGANQMRAGASDVAGTGDWQRGEMIQHLSPYTSGVVNEIGRLGTRNLQENVLPQVNSTFAGAGQFGSTRNADFTNRAIRDASRDIAGQQATALQNAYSQASKDYLDWDAAQRAAGTSLANIGSQYGQLGNLAAKTPADIYGAQAGYGLTLADRQANLPANIRNMMAAGMTSAGRQAAELPADLYNQRATSQMSLGNYYGTLPSSIYGSQASMLSNIGAQQANLPANIYNTLSSRLSSIGGERANLGNQMGTYGTTGQTQKWQDLTNLFGFGERERAIEQSAMDKSYEDWLKQITLPTTQLGTFGAMIPNISQLYQKNTTAAQYPTGAGNNDLNTLLAVLNALNTGGSTPAP